MRWDFLFRPLNASGEIMAAPFESNAAQARLSSYVSSLSHVFGSRNIALHGLRSGSAIALADGLIYHLMWAGGRPKRRNNI